MKLKLFALISVLSVGLLCACKNGDKPSSSEVSIKQTSEVDSDSKENPTTNNNPNTSYETPVTSSTESISSVSFTTSKDPSNPNFPLSNNEGGIVSWNNVGNI